jgi:hypothetical protein
MNDCHAICTTVIRGSTDRELHGNIYVVELQRGKVIRTIRIPQQSFVYGARGGSRGGRGVAVHRDRIFVAVFDKILVYNRRFELLGDIFHPQVVGHHEIAVANDGIWCCSTLVDALFHLDFDGNTLDAWWASEDAWFADQTGGRIVGRDRSFPYATEALNDLVGYDEQYHFNQVFRLGERVLTYSHQKAALVEFRPEPRIICRNSSWLAAHNALVVGLRFLINNTQRKRLEVFDWQAVNNGDATGGELTPESIVVIDTSEGLSDQFATSGWVRGLGVIDADRVVVGTSPAALCVVDLCEQRIVQRIELSDDLHEAVHGLCIAAP